MRQTTHIDAMVPLRDNSGRPFRACEFHRFEKFLLERAGGFTRGAVVDGFWKWNGVTKRDRLRPYFITVDVETADELAGEVDTYIQEHFCQIASYVETSHTKSWF